MSEEKKPPLGSIVWRDLTVPDASQLREFYAKIVGWEFGEHDMGDYADYNVKSPESGEVVAGLCHARGSNAKIPPQWMVYVTVADVAASASACEAAGGSVIDGPRKMGNSEFCVIRDPVGAVLGLISN